MLSNPAQFRISHTSTFAILLHFFSQVSVCPVCHHFLHGRDMRETFKRNSRSPLRHWYLFRRCVLPISGEYSNKLL
jgi:hypothetical protein